MIWGTPVVNPLTIRDLDTNELMASLDATGYLTVRGISSVESGNIHVYAGSSLLVAQMGPGGFNSIPEGAFPAYSADGSSGATVALDAGGLRIENASDVIADGSMQAAGVVAYGQGMSSRPDSPNAAYAVDANGSGTVALDAGGLPITNLPTSNPHIAGALWNNAGTPAISAG